MSNLPTSIGLSYKRLDLHVHTPASDCFSGGCTPDDIVRTALNAGLDGIAVTDHNTAKWVDLIKAAASNTPLVVFPGVEISCTGGKKNIHLIALLDPQANAQDVQTILNLVGIKPAQYGLAEAVTDKGPVEVIEDSPAKSRDLITPAE
jgi:predicted metal-dependent phosphoesterase TrpH